MENDVPKFKFKVSSLIKNIVGKDLIADDYIAVFELVKNAFDAHAKKVTITFEEDKIIIQDNGKGMSVDDLLNKWLFLAYSSKNEKIEDTEFEQEELKDYRDKIRPKKYYAGAKGIGRFSADKLGEQLLLTTRKVSEPTGTFHQLFFDWPLFEKKATALFEDFEIPNKELRASPYKEFEHGLVLEISKLRNVWNRKEMLRLKRSLEKLISPHESLDKKDDFEIKIIAKNEIIEDEQQNEYREKVNGSVKNFVFEGLDIKTTQIQSELSNGKIITTLFDRGKLVYKIIEDSSYSKLINAKILIFYLNYSAKITFSNTMGVNSVNFGHIFLFKNGFRVYPYGEFRFDPLGIDTRKVQGRGRFLGTREIIGRIEIWGNPNEEFQEKSSRDGGLVETVGKKETENFFYETLKKLERYVAPILWGITARTDDSEESLDTEAKKQIIDLINRLAGSKKITLLDFGKEVIDVFNESIENQSDEDFDRLIEIAKKANSPDFEQEIIHAKQRYLILLKEKEEAERMAREEEEKRIEAEAKAKEEEEKRIEAERQTKIAEENRAAAERKQQEEEYKRLKAEEEAREARERASLEEQRRKQKETQVRFLESVSSLDITDVLNMHHQIGIDANTIKTTLVNLLNRIKRDKQIDISTAETYITSISLATEKILSVVNYTTKANFLAMTLETEGDVVAFLRDYTLTILAKHYPNISFKINGASHKFIKHFRPIEMTIIMDNLVSNSSKKDAKNVALSFETNNNKLIIRYTDNGAGLDPKIADPNEVFQRGVTTTRGSGLGMFHVKNILTEMQGSISLLPKAEKGIEFIITIGK